jgi:tetratricopeptide (TPR) repeat protein
VTLVAQRQLESGLKAFDTAIRLDPEYPNPYYAAYYALSDAGQVDRAFGYLDRWLDAHPQDTRTRDFLDSQRRALGRPTESRPMVMPRSTAPSLP